MEITKNIYFMLLILSYIIIYFRVLNQHKERYKLKKVSIIFYSFQLEIIIFILNNIEIVLIKPNLIEYMILFILNILIVEIVIKRYLSTLKIKVLYKKNIYYLSIIRYIEVNILMLRLKYNRVKEFIFRSLKNMKPILGIILIEIISIGIFKYITRIENKEWEIFELILTTIIITSYINISNEEKERRTKLKTQSRNIELLEKDMNTYLDKIVSFIGIDMYSENKKVYCLEDSNWYKNKFKQYAETDKYIENVKININKIDNTRNCIDIYTKNFIERIKERKENIIYVNSNLNKENIFNLYIEYLQDFRVEENKAENREEIASIIIERVPDLMYFCSKVIKICKYPWNKNNAIYNRIEKLIVFQDQ